MCKCSLSMHACECVLVFVLHPTSCPGLRLSSSTTWWGKVGGGGCEGIHQPVPSLPGSQRLSLCDLITRPLAGTAALMLPGPTNQFASSKGKQPHLWEGCPHLHIRYVQYMHANVDAPQHKTTPGYYVPNSLIESRDHRDTQKEKWRCNQR